jgi:asparagine synthase (glutamine-hydrolysing)
VLLTGLGGDQWLAGSDRSYADLLRRGRFAEIWRNGRLEGLNWLEISTHTISPLLPERLTSVLKQIIGRGTVPSYIRRGFVKRVNLQDHWSALCSQVPSRDLASVSMWRTLHDGSLIQSFESTQRSQALFNLEERHPFYDRRLVEFIAAIPAEQRRKSGWEKVILRRSMKNRLPEKVLLRQSKADFTHLVMGALNNVYGRIEHESWERLLNEFIDPGKLPDLKRKQNIFAGCDGLPDGRQWNYWIIWSTALWMHWFHHRSGSLTEGSNLFF